MNRIAYINLTTGEVSTKEIPEEILRMYLGGKALGAYLLYNHTKKGTEPFSPENPFIVSAGFLGGYPGPWGRTAVNAVSGETGIYGSSNIGGAFGPELKYAGFQSLLVEGKAEKPSYIWIHDGEIEIRDASHLWGLDTYETQKRIWEELKDPEAQILTIGQAGERLCRIACVRHAVKQAAGKSGLGGPMGAKLLKAIAVRGSRGLPAKYPEKLIEITKKRIDADCSNESFRLYMEVGNLFLFPLQNEGGYLPAYNRRKNSFPEGYGNIDFPAFLENYKEKSLACHGCHMHCCQWYKIKSGPYEGTASMSGHLICQNSWGTYIGNTRFDVSLKAMETCDRYGIDTMAMGCYMGWLMDLWDRGLIDEKQTGGLKLEWGNPEAIMGLLDQIAQGVGLGKIISDGGDKAIERLGPKTGEYLYRCRKGLAFHAVNYQGVRGSLLGVSTTNRGADHLGGLAATIEVMPLSPELVIQIVGSHVNPDPLAYDTKALLAIWMQGFLLMCDTLGWCKNPSAWMDLTFAEYQHFCQVINAVTGWDMTREELSEIAERGFNVEKLFNVREGLNRENDMPPKFQTDPLPDGGLKGVKVDLDDYNKLLDEYYELRGWDKNGVPKRKTLKRLKLDKEPAHIL